MEKGLIIRGSQQALRHRHIQPNPPLQVAWLVFDLDYAGAAFAWENANLPPPSITVVNPSNAHAHLFYGLTTPITVSDAARDAPIRYGAAVQAAFVASLMADQGYVGLIAKNPLHNDWRPIWVNRVYDLGELAEYVHLPRTLPKHMDTGLGRNCILFDELRSWAYQWVRTYKKNDATPQQWHLAVLGQAQHLNRFDVPLTDREIAATVKSVATWTWKTFTIQRFAAIQSERGKRGGRPRTTTLSGEPWITQGVSRSTYYRRSKAV
ncbi:MAG TPA: replication initiation protein [Thiobacillaceae bacterium]|nr:replication initiation protein [Thiobacillaceae bacterium]